MIITSVHTMSSSQHLVDDNNSCSIDISFFILSRHNPSILYFFIGIGNTLCSISAVTGNAIILLALRRCSLLHFSSKALFFSLALSDFAVGLVSQPFYAAYTFAVAWNKMPDSTALLDYLTLCLLPFWVLRLSGHKWWWL